MTRGDQRDRDRQKALKKQQEKLKSQGKVRLYSFMHGSLCEIDIVEKCDGV